MRPSDTPADWLPEDRSELDRFTVEYRVLYRPYADGSLAEWWRTSRPQTPEELLESVPKPHRRGAVLQQRLIGPWEAM